jgi:hypothetical protein
MSRSLNAFACCVAADSPFRRTFTRAPENRFAAIACA